MRQFDLRRQNKYNNFAGISAVLLGRNGSNTGFDIVINFSFNNPNSTGAMWKTTPKSVTPGNMDFQPKDTIQLNESVTSGSGLRKFFVRLKCMVEGGLKTAVGSFLEFLMFDGTIEKTDVNYQM